MFECELSDYPCRTIKALKIAVRLSIKKFKNTWQFQIESICSLYLSEFMHHAATFCKNLENIEWHGHYAWRLMV